MRHKLIYYGNETLRGHAVPVEEFTPDISDIASEMHHLMGKANGIGLAAPQIGLPIRMVVINLSHAEGPVLSLVNPEIVYNAGGECFFEEGCLSIPGVFCDVNRPAEIVVEGCGVDGKKVEFSADGMLARVLQHEIDHLDGILFIDRIEEYQRKEFEKDFKRIRKMNKE